MGREMSGLMPWGTWRALYPLSLSLSLPPRRRLSHSYSDDSRCESRSLGPATLSKSEDSCLDSLVLSSHPYAYRVYSVINLICVYTIHTLPLRIAVVARTRISSLCRRDVIRDQLSSSRRSIYLWWNPWARDGTASWLPAISAAVSDRKSLIPFLPI